MNVRKVILKKKGLVGIIILNPQKKKNVIDAQVVSDLKDIRDHIQADDIRVSVITVKGKAWLSKGIDPEEV